MRERSGQNEPKRRQKRAAMATHAGRKLSSSATLDHHSHFRQSKIGEGFWPACKPVGMFRPDVSRTAYCANQLSEKGSGSVPVSSRYSWRNVAIGSNLIAWRAGWLLAASATMINKMTTPANVSGSVVVTPYRTLASTRVAA